MQIALMKLPHQVTLTPTVQLAKLPSDCQSLHRGGEAITIVGTGRYTIEKSLQNVLTIVRQAQFTTISSRECESILKGDLEQRSIICAKVANNQSAYDGDSGRQR